MLRCVVVLLVYLAGTSGCVGRGPALPQPAEVIEFAIPWENAFPSDVLVDDAGRVWFTDRMAQVIGRFDPDTREFERFELPTAKSAPYGFVRGPDGAFWYAAAVAGKLGRVDPETGEITEVELEGVSGGPQLLAVLGSELWFTAREAQVYGRYEPATGRLKTYSAPERFRPYGIATTNDRIWISSYDGGRLLEVDGALERARAHEVSPEAECGSVLAPATPESELSPHELMRWIHMGARRMAAGADGELWISGFGRSRVYRIDTVSGEVEEYPSLSTPSYPYGIVVAPDGLVWYNEKGNDAVIALDPRAGRRVTFRIGTTGATVRHLAVDAERGRVWLPLSDAGRLGLIELGSRD